MRHRRKGRKLGRNPNHQRALLRNLASALILTERDATDDDNKPKVKGASSPRCRRPRRFARWSSAASPSPAAPCRIWRPPTPWAPAPTGRARSGVPGGTASAGRSGARRWPPWWPPAAACSVCWATSRRCASFSATLPPASPIAPAATPASSAWPSRGWETPARGPSSSWSGSATASAAAPPGPCSRASPKPPGAGALLSRRRSREAGRHVVVLLRASCRTRRCDKPAVNREPAPLARLAACKPAGFDFTLHMRLLCQDMAARLEELRHIDMGLVAVSFAQARTAADCGMFASLTPLRFAGGQRHTLRRGRQWTLQRVCEGGREMLYILNFYLPRFLDLPLDEKLITVVHELLAHRPAVRRQPAAVRRPLLCPQRVEKTLRRPGRSGWSTVGWPSGRRSRSTISCTCSFASWPSVTAASSAGKSGPRS